jgi:ribosomal protein L11 methyltransferase
VIFGSGFHPSTRLCLETLELLMCQSGQRIESVLDLGTGTGLLSIAAAKLGASKVLALDNNPLAVDVANANIRRNDCRESVQVIRADLAENLPDTCCDLVIANLYKGLLLRLLEDPGFWSAQMYLLSGFMPGMEADLLAALDSRSVRMLHRGNSGPWRLWLLQNRSAEGKQQQ